MLMMFLISLIIVFIMMMINSIISKKMFKEREKMTPFECGFDPNSSARLPFSMRFFLIAVMFLIFDVEIVLILPIPIILNSTNFVILTYLSVFFLIILMGGLFYEWFKGALQWS